VSDCQTKRPIAAVITDGNVGSANAAGEFVLTAPDEDTSYTVRASARVISTRRSPSSRAKQAQLRASAFTRSLPLLLVLLHQQSPPTTSRLATQCRFQCTQRYPCLQHQPCSLDGPFPGAPSGQQREISGDDRNCIWEQVVGGHNYRFSIERCTRWITAVYWSEWVSVDFNVSLDTEWPG
jgi:hypothetical protein